MRNSISPSVRIQTLLAFAGSHQQLMQLLQLRIERYQLPYWRSWITSIWMRVSINCEETTSIDFESKPIAREQQFEIFQFRITTSLISSRIYGFIAFIGGKNTGTIPGLREKFAQVLLVQDGTRNTRSVQKSGGHARRRLAYRISLITNLEPKWLRCRTFCFACRNLRVTRYGQ